MNNNEQIILSNIWDEMISLVKNCDKAEDIETELKNKAEHFSKKLFSLKPEFSDLEIKHKKDFFLSLLELEQISIDEFTKSYLEKANVKSVDLATLFITSGEYKHTLSAEGYIKDILVGNITEMTQIIRQNDPTQKRNPLYESYSVKNRRDQEENIAKLSKEQNLTVRAYFNIDDFTEKEYDEENFEVLCKISEWEWATFKMSLPILADNYSTYDLYDIVYPNGTSFKVIQG